ncbi:hypothetical protein CARUB_v10018145mg [Capsella rubella]|uniref:Uncharacterized protein n=1 Tax=Capsella rubella TaxID=81985 RepID=R0HI21_9BRAS|nr:protein SHOOT GRAVITROPISM 5 [Capsella rubella]EOA24855.1 hypothetical protein CARUB_v10018145mg [Capsella rubella]
MAEQQHQDHHKELQLLPSTESPVRKHRPTVISTDHHHHHHHHNHNNRSSSMIHHDLDLKLSISLSSITTAAEEHPSGGGVEALKWQAAEQIRLAAIEKAYAERVRELTRREMEMAQSEFARARVMWQKAREEVERAERLKERSMTKIDTACLEITCHSCRQRFRP